MKGVEAVQYRFPMFSQAQPLCSAGLPRCCLFAGSLRRLCSQDPAELRKRLAAARFSVRKCGSPSKQGRKPHVRHTLKLLLDSESDFFEIGTLAGDVESLPAAGLVTGIGRVAGVDVCVSVNDWSVKGGSTFPMTLKKQLRIQEISRILRLPSVYLVDSGGAYLPAQADIFPDKHHGGRVFRNEAVLGAAGLPQLAVVLGSVTAGGAYVPMMCDDVVIVAGLGSLFLGGPPLVKAATGEIHTAEELGGADLHCSESGCTDYYAGSVEEAIQLCRELVENLPSTFVAQNETRTPEHCSVSDDEARFGFASGERDRSLIYRVPSISLQTVAGLSDDGKICEFRQRYSPAGLIVGYVRLARQKVGVVASVGSGVDRKSAEKAGQFVQMCSVRRQPIVFLQGPFCRSIGSESSTGWSHYTQDDIRAHADLLRFVATSSSPIITILTDRCGGAEHLLLCPRSFSPSFLFAWPNASIQFDSKSPPLTAFEAAERLIVDELIDPQETRQVLIKCILLFRAAAERRSWDNLSELF